MGEVIRPVEHVEESESAGEKHPRDDVNLFGSELDIVVPFRETISAPLNGYLKVKKGAGRDHGGTFDPAHQGVLERGERCVVSDTLGVQTFAFGSRINCKLGWS